MPPYHLSSASRALYRVFIAPSLSRPTLFQPITPALALPRNVLTNQTLVRAVHYKKRDTRRKALKDMYTFDSAIKADYINFVDEAGKMHRDVPLHDAMSSFNTTFNHLLLVDAGKVDAFGRSDPNHLPLCKVISKMQLREQHQKKLEIERRGNAGTGPSGKNLELNWAIAAGDLKHRLKKLKEFLLQGRKVEILIGPKRRGRVATPEEGKDVLEKIREAVGECKGASEFKEPEGKVGAVMTLVFQGRKLDKEKTAEGKEGETEEEAQSV